jgi:hypothetical protein
MRPAGKTEKSVRTYAWLRGKAQLSAAVGIAVTGLAALGATDSLLGAQADEP